MHVFIIAVGGTGALLSKVVDTGYVLDDVIKNRQAAETLLPQAIKHHITAPTESAGPRSLKQILDNGTLRVGYNRNQLPFSYFNAKGHLVGFDFELIRDLGADLQVVVDLVPYTLTTAAAMLNSGKFDIAVSGLEMTAARLAKVRLTQPILTLHYSVVVEDHRADDFQTDDRVRAAGPLKVAATGLYSIIPLLDKKFENIEIIQTDSDQAFFTTHKGKFDGLLVSLEAGKTWTMLYPEYATVFRRNEVKSFPASWALAMENIDLLTYMNSWLELRRSVGTVDTLYDYWILGKNAVPAESRWSVIRDVLPWVDDK